MCTISKNVSSKHKSYWGTYYMTYTNYFYDLQLLRGNTKFHLYFIWSGGYLESTETKISFIQQRLVHPPNGTFNRNSLGSSKMNYVYAEWRVNLHGFLPIYAFFSCIRTKMRTSTLVCTIWDLRMKGVVYDTSPCLYLSIFYSFFNEMPLDDSNGNKSMNNLRCWKLFTIFSSFPEFFSVCLQTLTWKQHFYCSVCVT
jgi:hypothetical protein